MPNKQKTIVKSELSKPELSFDLKHSKFSITAKIPGSAHESGISLAE